MHEEILTAGQKKLLPLLKRFSGDFGLVGGTAIALQLGHRRSVDFDLFATKDFDAGKMRSIVREGHEINRVFVEAPNELTIVIDGIKSTFYKYPFRIKFTLDFDGILKMPDLLTLAAMKAFALGRRAKWKDYVDLYFVLRQINLLKIIQKAENLFGNEFNQKLLREQLSYFEDVDYSEEVIYLPGFEKNDAEIKKFLTEISLQKN